MSKTIYKSHRYNGFIQENNTFFYEEEGPLIGYGMGAHAAYTEKIEISEEEFENKQIYIETILSNDISKDMLFNIQDSLNSQENVPTYIDSDAFEYDGTIPIYPMYRGKRVYSGYNYGFVKTEDRVVYWKSKDIEKQQITYYKEFDCESDAYKEAIRWMLVEYYGHVSQK